MQRKKSEIENDIIEAATEEFFYHGYKDASLRTIARKANTSLGNLYHYFDSKAMILDAVLQDFPDKVLNFIVHHHDSAPFIPRNEITLDILFSLREYIQLFTEQYFKMLSDRRVVIVLQGCEGTKFEHYNTDIRDFLTKHFYEHFEESSSSAFPRILTDSIIDTIVNIVKKNSDAKIANQAILDYLDIIILGMTCKLMNQ